MVRSYFVIIYTVILECFIISKWTRVFLRGVVKFCYQLNLINAIKLHLTRDLDLLLTVLKFIDTCFLIPKCGNFVNKPYILKRIHILHSLGIVFCICPGINFR